MLLVLILSSLSPSDSFTSDSYYSCCFFGVLIYCFCLFYPLNMKLSLSSLSSMNISPLFGVFLIDTEPRYYFNTCFLGIYFLLLLPLWFSPITLGTLLRYNGRLALLCLNLYPWLGSRSGGVGCLPLMNPRHRF